MKEMKMKASNPKERNMKTVEDYSKGIIKVYRTIKRRGEAGLKTTDLDISESTKLSIGTVYVYRLTLVNDGFVSRDGSRRKRGRKRLAWGCLKSLQSNKDEAKVGKVYIPIKSEAYRARNKATVTSKARVPQSFISTMAGKQVVRSIEKLCVLILKALNKDLTEGRHEKV